jgi:hypothetical protein
MGDRKVTGNIRELPQKIEQRLAELVRMGEFDEGDVSHCRRTYWDARDDWHSILIDCYDRAKQQPEKSTA